MKNSVKVPTSEFQSQPDTKNITLRFTGGAGKATSNVAGRWMTSTLPRRPCAIGCWIACITGEKTMEPLAFVKERNAALRSLDKAKILAYAKKYDLQLPTNDLSFWAGIHKARLQVTAMTDAEREVSRRWLMEHGFQLSLFGAPPLA